MKVRESFFFPSAGTNWNSTSEPSQALMLFTKYAWFNNQKANNGLRSGSERCYRKIQQRDRTGQWPLKYLWRLFPAQMVHQATLMGFHHPLQIRGFKGEEWVHVMEGEGRGQTWRGRGAHQPTIHQKPPKPPTTTSTSLPLPPILLTRAVAMTTAELRPGNRWEC